MKAVCEVSGEQFEVSDAERAYCEKNGIPIPRLSPFERLREMLIFRNRRASLYQATCAMTGKSILSQIPPESGLTVYDVEEWQSDRWDSKSYGRDFDFSKPFFEQFADLYRTVPHPNLAVIRGSMENSDYTNGITGAKNCYLLFASSFNEDCMYSYMLYKCKDVVDCVFAFESELCYHCEDVFNCYNVRYCYHCESCSESAYLFNCRACKDCFACTNLNQKQYCFNNQQLSKEDYHNKIAEIDFGSYSQVQKILVPFQESTKSVPVKHYFGKKNENSTGNYLTSTKNCNNGHYLTNCEDVENSIFLTNCRDCFSHAMFGNEASLVYNSVSCGENVYNLKFCMDCWPGSHDLEYCAYVCYGSHNCFGCVGLKKAEYCILNKQYQKDDYEALVNKIKAHMRSTGEYGRFFPLALSPYYYDESEAMSFLPLSREEALRRGYRWNERKASPPKERYSPPDAIQDVGDEIVGKTLQCEESGAAYKIIKPELAFYRQMGIPIPRRSPRERIVSRLKFFNLRPLREIQCAKTGEALKTVLDSSLREIYSEDAFVEKFY